MKASEAGHGVPAQPGMPMSQKYDPSLPMAQVKPSASLKLVHPNQEANTLLMNQFLINNETQTCTYKLGMR